MRFVVEPFTYVKLSHEVPVIVKQRRRGKTADSGRPTVAGGKEGER